MRGRSFSPRFRRSFSTEAAQIRISASQMVAIPNSWFGKTLTNTSPLGLVYSIGFSRLRLARLKNGRSIVSRWSRSGRSAT